MHVTWKASWAAWAAVVVAAVVVVGTSVAWGQQKYSGTLTAADYVEIQQLAVRYAYAVDTHADNGYAYADLFAKDGVFGGKTQGREALAKLAMSTQAERGRPGLHAALPDERDHLPDAGRRAGQSVPGGHRRGRGRQAEQHHPRRPLRRRLREDAGRLALQVPPAASQQDRRASADGEDSAGPLKPDWYDTEPLMRNTIRNRVILLSVAVGVLGMVLAQAQQSRSGAASGVMALTAMDYIQIKQLVNRYAFARRHGLAQRLRLRRSVRARRRLRQQHARPDEGPRQPGVAGPRRQEGPAARQPLHLRPHHRADGHRRDRAAVP